MVHVDSGIEQFDERSTLEYAHFYPSNNPDLAFVTVIFKFESKILSVKLAE
jgi:hypothetical protein